MTTLYGIKNCDSVKKARKWLEGHGIAYRFHDFRLDGLELATLQRWAAAVDWERLLNKRSSSWRQLAPEQREGIDEVRALQLMAEQPTLIKRPVLEYGAQLVVGFEEDEYASLFR